MKAGKYTIQDFFVNRYLKQVIVPEIQRDYVWQAEQLRGLLASLLADFRRFNEFRADVQAADPGLVESFREYQRRRSCAASIGFVYAYSDEELPGRYFLIDGQQRLTSVFLMLLALAHRQPGALRGRFRQLFYDGGRLKLDYHVREAAHDFLVRLVPFLLPESPSASPGELTDQAWYYAATRADVTIGNLVQNFQLMQQAFGEAEFQQLPAATADDTGAARSAEELFFDYLANYTEFYYFDTNVSEQGEDLYIYMNARGEQMAGNENIKADLLGRLTTPAAKDAWGKEWEAWQDFFWQHRTSGGAQNENADAGFNAFLACIAGLTDLVNGRKSTNTSTNTTSRILASLYREDAQQQLADIRRYVRCLQYLHDNAEGFGKSYGYAGWIEPCLAKVWSMLNTERIDWYADYTDDNRSKERRHMALVWPVLRFLFKYDDLATLAPSEAFRVLRVHYVRYHNNDRSVANLEAEAEQRVKGVFSTAATDEEQLKHALYVAVEPAMVPRFEELIWQIEDHELNLDSSGVGNTNISHLIDLEPNITPEDLERVRNAFYELFPQKQKNYLGLQNALLAYGPYQNRENPWHYYSYNFGNWKRTIRGKGSEEVFKPVEERAFRLFFQDFLLADVSLDDFLAGKSADLIDQSAAHEFHQKARWYSQQLGTTLWLHGKYLGFSDDWNGCDNHFPDHPIIYNTSGDMRSAYGSLQKLLPIVAST